MSWNRAEFNALVKSWGLRYFKADELLARVGAVRRGARNSPPPRELWANMEATARVVDELRRRLGVPIVITSAYRDPDYNRAVGGARASQHLQFRALDIHSPAPGVGPKRIYNELVTMRKEGFFRGGIGLYRTFVHVDTRGVNTTW